MTQSQVFTDADTLTVADESPGFQVAVREVFEV